MKQQTQINKAEWKEIALGDLAGQIVSGITGGRR